MAGRPTKYSPKYHPKLANILARTGLIDEEIAKELGITRSTLSRWKELHAEFSDALKEGKKIPDDKVQAELFRRACGYDFAEEILLKDENGEMVTKKIVKKHQPPDVTACIFWLKNRRPDQWRDKREFEGDVYVLKPSEVNKPADTGLSE